MRSTGSYRATLASRGTVLLPRALKGIETGVWLYGSTSRIGTWANQISGRLAAIRVGLVPGRNVDWSPPPDVGTEKLMDELALILQRRVRSWIVQLPADRRRRRFNLLLLDEVGQPIAFAKFTANAPNALAMTALRHWRDAPAVSFWAPALLASGGVGPYSYTVTSLMPAGPHRPARVSSLARRSFIDEMQAQLSSAVVSPDVFVHGDFAPWNLRRVGPTVALVDWEEATAGPVAADELWYLAALAVRRRVRPERSRSWVAGSTYGPSELEAAAAFWLERLSRPEPAEIDASVGAPIRLRENADRIKRLLSSLV